ncbi:MAG: cysteine desulfurase [Melioribacteraceae bacterium]|nr:cysteine desulfurase [Melioribacteraceae bacterium]MDD3556938.1 cysteine desulfurase [Melioribacteraceae bacterium]
MDFTIPVEKSVQKDTTKRTFDLEKIRSDFPILERKVNGKQLIYLDNAATTQKPDVVIESIKHYYTFENANIHRGLHFLSELATESYETSRLKIKEFINAMSAAEIVFLRGATEAINLVAHSMCRGNFFDDGDEIIISEMEHHANIVPWQMLCERRNVKLKVVPIDDNGDLIFEEFEKLLNPKTKLVSITHTSNSLGTVNPIKEIIDLAHKNGVPVLVDGAQAVQHGKIDVQELDCDFFVFSGHKLYGPTGTGILYGKADLLNKMPPYQGGGDMIREVTFEKTTFNDIPNKFEAGTPNIAGSIGLGVAVKYLNSFDINDIISHEVNLLNYATKKLLEIDGLKIIGTAKNKSAVISFVVDGVHPYDIGTMLDTQGIAIRTGHHCTQPIMRRYNLPATARISFGIYNTIQEVDYLIEALNKILKMIR